MKIKSKNGAFLRFHTVIECHTKKPKIYRNLIDSANLFLQKRGQRKTSFEKFACLKKKVKLFIVLRRLGHLKGGKLGHMHVF